MKKNFEIEFIKHKNCFLLLVRKSPESKYSRNEYQVIFPRLRVDLTIFLPLNSKITIPGVKGVLSKPL